MCKDYAKVCRCGKQSVSFNFKNDVMPPEIVAELYCPQCARELAVDKRHMLQDNGWVIKFDMDVASLYRNKLPAMDAQNLSPEVLFDEGYATWRGIYPGDHIDSIKEREELAAISKTDPKRYFEKMRKWAVARMSRLKEEGWRKAYDG